MRGDIAPVPVHGFDVRAFHVKWFTCVATVRHSDVRVHALSRPGNLQINFQHTKNAKMINSHYEMPRM